jgi:exonuclease SbcC
MQQTRDALVQLAADLKAQQERQQALQAEQHSLDARLNDWRALHPELDDAGLNRLLAFDDAQVSALRQQLQHSEKPSNRPRCCCKSANSASPSIRHCTTAIWPNSWTPPWPRSTSNWPTARNTAPNCARQAEDQRRQDANQALDVQIAKAYEEWQRWAA